MKERPILFSAQMVRAILDGTKTQTRRVVKPQPRGDPSFECGGPEYKDVHAVMCDGVRTMCPYGQPGGKLWVRETWAAPHSEDARPPRGIQCDQIRIHYAATEDRGGLLWRPSIHMPRWASRITLEITGVRVERLQDISIEDCWAEGAAEWASENPPRRPDGTADKFNNIRQAYRALWESINGPGSWDENHWVWVVEFKRLEAA